MVELSGLNEWLPQEYFLEEIGNPEEIFRKIDDQKLKFAESLGWFDILPRCNNEMLQSIEDVAKEIHVKADVFVIVGVGGSINAARSVIEALHTNERPKVIFAGNTISAFEINKILKQLEGKSVFINMIAKNFETLEPGIAFRTLRRYLRNCYGETYNERIIVTGTEGSHLQMLCQKHNYRFFRFPPDIGGRFSAISEVGLLPIAAAGIDIRSVVRGAAMEREDLLATRTSNNPALQYATARKILWERGYRIELLSFFEPRLQYFAIWWTQLFAESEGKEDKGIYPVAASYSEDLHSVGQFVQEGTRTIAETFLEIAEADASHISLPDEIEDRFDYLNGMDYAEINKRAAEATFQAHTMRLPCMKINVQRLDEETFGRLFFFFEYACYLSGILLCVNPFDQPGVEDYKERMFLLLGKKKG